MMLPNEAMTIQNGLERSMKAGIIMVRRNHAGRKTLTLTCLTPTRAWR